MKEQSEAVEVTNNPELNRYEIHLDGELAGFLQYELDDGLIRFVHTQVDPAFAGRGAGSTLVRSALDDVRVAGRRKVLPLCPFAKKWIEHHRDYLDLLA